MLVKFEKDVLKIAALFRICIGIISITFDQLIDDHDHSSELLFAKSSDQQLSWISSILKCFVRWDALFYVSIAENDYEYLKNHAFFPLFSKLARSVKDSIVKPLSPLNDIDALIVTGLSINFVIHLANVLIFYR
jgi:hypothetical protein